MQVTLVMQVTPILWLCLWRDGMKLEMTDLIYHNLIPIYINNTKGKYPFTVSHPKFDTPGLNK